MGREGDEQRHDQDQLAEELEAHQVERDGHVRRAAPLVELELERDRDVGVDDPYSDLQAFEVEKSLCIVGLFGVDGPGSYGPGVPREAAYSGFIWDRTTETWDDFPAPPIVVTHLSQKDGYIAASGNHSYDIGPEIHPSAPGERLFVMSPGSRVWAEWTFPQDIANPWDYRFAAVRIG